MTRKEDEGEMVGFGMRQVQPLALLGRGTLRKKRRGCTRGGEKCWGMLMSSLLLLLFGFFLARVESLAELGAGISWLCAVAPLDEAARQHVRRRRLLCKAR